MKEALQYLVHVVKESAICLWILIDGRKTTIGLVAGNILVWLQTKHVVDDPTAILVASLLSLWSGLAITHKAKKGEL
jgi:hypothetical protein